MNLNRWKDFKSPSRWPSGRVSDSEVRGPGFNIYLPHVMSLSKDTFSPKKVLVIPRKRWLRHNMTEKLLTGKVSINTKKNIIKTLFLIIMVKIFYRYLG